jgi:hypothetical protein
VTTPPLIQLYKWDEVLGPDMQGWLQADLGNYSQQVGVKFQTGGRLLNTLSLPYGYCLPYLCQI